MAHVMFRNVVLSVFRGSIAVFANSLETLRLGAMEHSLVHCGEDFLFFLLLKIC